MVRPFQFRLQTIFWATAAVGAGCAAAPVLAPVIEPVLGWILLPLYVGAGIWFVLLPYEKPMDENPYQAPRDDGDRPNSKLTPKRPFTLLELLVVLLIIGALISLLKPARSKARRPRPVPPPASAPQPSLDRNPAEKAARPDTDETVSPSPTIS